MAGEIAAILDGYRPLTVLKLIICPSYCRAHHRLPTEGDIFSKYCYNNETPLYQPRPWVNVPASPPRGFNV